MIRFNKFVKKQLKNKIGKGEEIQMIRFLQEFVNKTYLEKNNKKAKKSPMIRFFLEICK